MGRKKREIKREEYPGITIGPLLKKILTKQKEMIKRATYDVCVSSDYEAGEIIAKKVIENNVL